MNTIWNKAGYAVCAVLVSGMIQSANAEEEIKITIDKVTVEDAVYTPYYRVDTEREHQQGASSRWIRLGVYFTTEGGWIDELDITQMALKFNKELDQSVILSEKVHYINIEPGDHSVYVYLHPSYVERFEISDFDLDTAAIIEFQGKVVAQMETARRNEKGWSDSDTLLARKKGYLLNQAETPFWFINYDFQEVIKQ